MFPCFPSECRCHNHADSCHFDLSVWLASGKRSGGVCDNCKHNTEGHRCQRCKPGYYRDKGKPMSSSEVCKRKWLLLCPVKMNEWWKPVETINNYGSITVLSLYFVSRLQFSDQRPFFWFAVSIPLQCHKLLFSANCNSSSNALHPSESDIPLVLAFKIMWFYFSLEVHFI